MRAQGVPLPLATCFSDEVNGAAQEPAPNRIQQVGAFLQLMKCRVTNRFRIGPVDQMVQQVRCWIKVAGVANCRRLCAFVNG